MWEPGRWASNFVQNSHFSHGPDWKMTPFWLYFFSFASFPVIIEPSLLLGGCSLAWTCCSVTFFRMSLIVLLSSSSAAWAEASRTSCCSFRESELISSIQLEDTSWIWTLAKQEQQLLWQSQVAAGPDWSRANPDWSWSKLDQVQTGVGLDWSKANPDWSRSRLEQV